MFLDYTKPDVAKTSILAAQSQESEPAPPPGTFVAAPLPPPKSPFMFPDWPHRFEAILRIDTSVFTLKPGFEGVDHARPCGRPLTFGVGATITLFSLAYGVLFRPLPWPDAERTVRLYETRQGATRRFGAIVTSAAYAACLLTAAAIACAIPARRAAGIDPVEALRR